MGFMAGLLADFDSYLETGDIDFERDGAGYRTGIGRGKACAAPTAPFR